MHAAVSGMQASYMELLEIRNARGKLWILRESLALRFSKVVSLNTSIIYSRYAKRPRNKVARLKRSGKWYNK